MPRGGFSAAVASASGSPKKSPSSPENSPTKRNDRKGVFSALSSANVYKQDLSEQKKPQRRPRPAVFLTLEEAKALLEELRAICSTQEFQHAIQNIRNQDWGAFKKREAVAKLLGITWKATFKARGFPIDERGPPEMLLAIRAHREQPGIRVAYTQVEKLLKFPDGALFGGNRGVWKKGVAAEKAAAQNVEIAVRHIDDGDEVRIIVPQASTMLQVKEALARRLGYKDLITEGFFIKREVDGTFTPLADGHFLGSRTTLLLKGPSIIPGHAKTRELTIKEVKDLLNAFRKACDAADVQRTLENLNRQGGETLHRGREMLLGQIWAPAMAACDMESDREGLNDVARFVRLYCNDEQIRDAAHEVERLCRLELGSIFAIPCGQEGLESDVVLPTSTSGLEALDPELEEILQDVDAVSRQQTPIKRQQAPMMRQPTPDSTPMDNCSIDDGVMEPQPEIQMRTREKLVAVDGQRQDDGALEPQPEIKMRTGRKWLVVGGVRQGGILVRSGQSYDSEEFSERLACSAVIIQLGLEGNRLHYQKLEGVGPDFGWVNIQFKGRTLVEPLEALVEPPPDSPSEDESSVADEADSVPSPERLQELSHPVHGYPGQQAWPEAWPAPEKPTPGEKSAPEKPTPGEKDLTADQRVEDDAAENRLSQKMPDQAVSVKEELVEEVPDEEVHGEAAVELPGEEMPDQAVSVEEEPCKEVPDEEVHGEAVEELPGEEMPDQAVSVKEEPCKKASDEEVHSEAVEELHGKEMPGQAVSVKEEPCKEAPDEEVHGEAVEELHGEEMPDQEVSVKEEPCKEAPDEEVHGEDVEELPGEEMPNQAVSVQEEPCKEAPDEEMHGEAVEELPGKEMPDQAVSVKDEPCKEAPDEEVHREAAKELHGEETPDPEVSVEEEPCEDAPDEEVHHEAVEELLGEEMPDQAVSVKQEPVQEALDEEVHREAAEELLGEVVEPLPSDATSVKKLNRELHELIERFAHASLTEESTIVVIPAAWTPWQKAVAVSLVSCLHQEQLVIRQGQWILSSSIAMASLPGAMQIQDCVSQVWWMMSSSVNSAPLTDARWLQREANEAAELTYVIANCDLEGETVEDKVPTAEEVKQLLDACTRLVRHATLSTAWTSIPDSDLQRIRGLLAFTPPCNAQIGICSTSLELESLLNIPAGSLLPQISIRAHRDFTNPVLAMQLSWDAELMLEVPWSATMLQLKLAALGNRQSRVLTTMILLTPDAVEVSIIQGDRQPLASDRLEFPKVLVKRGEQNRRLCISVPHGVTIWDVAKIVCRESGTAQGPEAMLRSVASSAGSHASRSEGWRLYVCVLKHVLDRWDKLTRAIWKKHEASHQEELKILERRDCKSKDHDESVIEEEKSKIMAAATSEDSREEPTISESIIDEVHKTKEKEEDSKEQEEWSDHLDEWWEDREANKASQHCETTKFFSMTDKAYKEDVVPGNDAKTEFFAMTDDCVAMTDLCAMTTDEECEDTEKQDLEDAAQALKAFPEILEMFDSIETPRDQQCLESVEPVETPGDQRELESAEPVEVPRDQQDLESAEPVKTPRDHQEEPVETSREQQDLESAEPAEHARYQEDLESVEPVETSREHRDLEIAEPVKASGDQQDLVSAEPVQTPRDHQDSKSDDPVETSRGQQDLESAEPVETPRDQHALESAEPVETSREQQDLENAELVETPRDQHDLESAEPVETAREQQDLESAEPVAKANWPFQDWPTEEAERRLAEALPESVPPSLTRGKLGALLRASPRLQGESSVVIVPAEACAWQQLFLWVVLFGLGWNLNIQQGLWSPTLLEEALELRTCIGKKVLWFASAALTSAPLRVARCFLPGKAADINGEDWRYFVRDVALVDLASKVQAPSISEITQFLEGLLRLLRHLCSTSSAPPRLSHDVMLCLQQLFDLTPMHVRNVQLHAAIQELELLLHAPRSFLLPLAQMVVVGRQPPLVLEATWSASMLQLKGAILLGEKRHSKASALRIVAKSVDATAVVFLPSSRQESAQVQDELLQCYSVIAHGQSENDIFISLPSSASLIDLKTKFAEELVERGSGSERSGHTSAESILELETFAVEELALQFVADRWALFAAAVCTRDQEAWDTAFQAALRKASRRKEARRRYQKKRQRQRDLMAKCPTDYFDAEKDEEHTKVWIVMGGENGDDDSAGINVRSARGFDKEDSWVYRAKLVPGSRIEGLDIFGNWLHYKKLRGAGPDFGWVFFKKKKRHLLDLELPEIDMSAYIGIRDDDFIDNGTDKEVEEALNDDTEEEVDEEEEFRKSEHEKEMKRRQLKKQQEEREAARKKEMELARREAARAKAEKEAEEARLKEEEEMRRWEERIRRFGQKEEEKEEEKEDPDAGLSLQQQLVRRLNPCMHDMEMDDAEEGRLWIVVGDTGKGGILVRRGEALDSVLLPTRLSQGTRVEELDLEGNRLHYKRIRGDGPDFGWVNVITNDKVMMELEVQDS